MTQLLERYLEQFGENFPLFALDLAEEEAKAILQTCLDTGQPYRPDDHGSDTLY